MKLLTIALAAVALSPPSVGSEFFGIAPGQEIGTALDRLNKVQRFEGGTYDEAWSGLVPDSSVQVILGANDGSVDMIQVTEPNAFTLADRADIRALEERFGLPVGSRIVSECGAELVSLQCALIYYECDPEPPTCRYSVMSVIGGSTQWTKVGYKSAP